MQVRKAYLLMDTFPVRSGLSRFFQVAVGTVMAAPFFKFAFLGSPQEMGFSYAKAAEESATIPRASERRRRGLRRRPQSTSMEREN